MKYLSKITPILLLIFFIMQSCAKEDFAIQSNEEKASNSIAKIMTYFQTPADFSYNGYVINWDALNASAEYGEGRVAAAHLLRGISSACDCWYFYNGTFTFPGTASAYMRSMGFPNAHRYPYSLSRVMSMLNEGKPLIIYSVPGINIMKAHCWNIDGYRISERTSHTVYYEDGLEISRTSNTETRKMVHCDFGWEGDCSGYFISGVFKLDDPNVIFDKGNSRNNTTHYNNIVYLITY